MAVSWEQLDENTFRMRVYKGWIVLHKKSSALIGSNVSCAESEAMVFVPDFNGDWKV